MPSPYATIISGPANNYLASVGEPFATTVTAGITNAGLTIDPSITGIPLTVYVYSAIYALTGLPVLTADLPSLLGGTLTQVTAEDGVAVFSDLVCLVANISYTSLAVASSGYDGVTMRTTNVFHTTPAIPGPIIPPPPPVPPNLPKDIFKRIRGRAYAVIKKYGSDVRFTTADTPATQDGEGNWTEVVPGQDFSGKGIQTAGDPDQIMMAKGDMILTNPTTVLVAALNLGGIPAPGMTMLWGGLGYTVKLVMPVEPNTKPIYYTVVGVT
jgi:hypothetical protein